MVVTAILPDLPTTEDHLDFGASAAALAGIVGDEGTATPITVGVFGTWGTGKTSLMCMIEAALVKQSRRKRGLKAHTVWFDAWKYDKERELWRALLMRVLEAVRAVAEGRPTSEHDEWPVGEKSPYSEEEREKIIKTLDDMAASLYREVEREELGHIEVDRRALAKAGVRLAGRLVLPFVPGVGFLAEFAKVAQGEAAKGSLGALFDAVQRQKIAVHRDQVRFLEQFQRDFRDLIAKHIIKHNRRLIVFVDDLDRCLPEKAIEVLEAIKLFLDVEGCVFVIGVDRGVIERGIQVKYRELQRAMEVEGERTYQRPAISGADYLEKIIQLPFILPPVEAGQVATFIRETMKHFPDDDVRCVDVFALGVERNPRKIKRCLNVFLLLWNLALEREKAPGVIRPVRLAKVVVIQQRHNDFYQLLIEEPERLARLEAYFRGEKRREEAQPARRAELMGRGRSAVEELAMIEMSKPRPRIEKTLEPFTTRHALRQLLILHDEEQPDANFTDVPAGQLRDYIYLTRATAEPPPEPERKVTIPVPEVVPVPAGPFTMGTRREDIPALVEKYGREAGRYEREVPQHGVNLPAFKIGKYLVTNREYQAFVRGGAGYRPPSHWDGDEYPSGQGDHPVVNVSWHDAVAYCSWLTEQTGQLYRLPTEAEWEKAARGSDGRQYPWGNEFDPARCNSGEGGPGETTPVGQYPEGASPYGILDMAGNVWEWCSTLYKPYPYDPGDGRENPEAEGGRVLRGGTFSDGARHVRCAFRYRNFPYTRNRYYGFRVVASPVASGL